MKYFTVYNATGEILRSGKVPDEDFAIQVIEPNEFILECATIPDRHMIDPVSKELILKPIVNAEVTRTYADKRSVLYPNIVEQLDMLWKAMDTDKLPKDNDFYNIIKTIKDQYPKSIAEPTNNITLKVL